MNISINRVKNPGHYRVFGNMGNIMLVKLDKIEDATTYTWEDWINVEKHTKNERQA